MICVELAFTADPQRLAARPAHHERTAALHRDGTLVAAGPFADESGAPLIFSGDEDVVRAALGADPGHRVPGVEVIGLRPW